MIEEQVIWKAIPFTNGRYEASNEGRVRNTKTGKSIAQTPNDKRGGYMQVRIYPVYGCHNRWVTVHKCVLSAFVGELPIGMQTNHIDGDKTNNRLENLEYVTPKENINHAQKMGLFNAHGTPTPNMKVETVLKIRELKRTLGIGYRRIATIMNMSPSTVRCVMNGDSWKDIKEE